MMRQPGPQDVDPALGEVPPWHVILRGLREAAGITQEGWAAHLGYGRRTVQRWESGISRPDAAVTEALIALCAERGLFRTYRRGSLAGVSINADRLRALLADARISRNVQPPALLDRHAGREPVGRAGLTPIRQTHTSVHNLPWDLTSFVGRVEERSALARLVEASKLVTLIGPGGVGKTRLAVAVAREMAQVAPDGVWLAELGDLRQPSLVIQRVAMTVGAREVPNRDPGDVLIEYLRPRRLLLLLDNCEHLLSECAGLIGRLQRDCPRVQVLATSREPLGLPAEIVWRVPSLELPPVQTAQDIDILGHVEAIELFVERARAQLPVFELTAENAPSVVRICRRLDGIPLALELAAAWARVLTPAEIETRLGARFDLLASVARSAPSRQQTVWASIHWSYELLDPDEAHLFDRLSVFPGSFTLVDVEQVCADDTLADVLNLLARLVDKSLVLADPSRPGQVTYYRVLDTVRAYGAERLAERGETNDIRSAHATWMVDQAEQAGTAIHGPEQRFWLHWIDHEDANIRAALEWSLQQDVAIALRLCADLAWPWGVLGHATEGRSWLKRALEHPESAEHPELRSRMIALLGMMSVLRGDLITADRLSRQVTVAEEHRADAVALLVASVARVQILQDAGDPAAALAADDVMRLARQVNDNWYMIRLTEILARAALRRGDVEGATAQLQEGVRLARRAGDTWSLAQVLNNLGDVARSTGQHVEAGGMYQESLSLREELGIPGLTPSLRHNLGYVALAAADPVVARSHFRSAMNEFSRVGDRRGMIECLIGMAAVTSAEGQDEEAARMFGAGTSALSKLGASIWPANQADVERWKRLAQSRIGDEAFTKIYDRGQAMSLEDALDVAAAQLRE